jgi:light-regulated signal transduction histidine kinase (bacteriophytochrome)
MANLIDDLLTLSRLGRATLTETSVKLRQLVDESIAQLAPEMAGRPVSWRIGELPEVRGDPTLLRNVVMNLLGNALKYSRGREPAVIEVGSTTHDDEVVCFFKDNGVGFDMRFADKLFGVFQRLHRPEEFEGTGIGLASVRRIVQRHGGRTWAEGAVDQGATFYFSLPLGGKAL